MSDDRVLVYNFNEHGLYYENNDNQNVNKKITLTIGTVQLEFDYNIRNLLSVSGYLPFVKAIKKNIDIPQYIKDLFCISMDSIEYMSGVAYDYFNSLKSAKNILWLMSIILNYTMMRLIKEF